MPRRSLALLLILGSLAFGVEGCFFFGGHDGHYHRNFAYETPERTSASHAHHQRAYHW